ncbi:hypothetical protein [Rhizobium sp.]|uniref:hypothetical protein n=1 Tax=Rhizobium sp. TaxID=391 RepID=UPI0028ABBF42
MEKMTFPRTLFFVGGTLAQRRLITNAATDIAGLATRLRPDEWQSDAARRYLDAHTLVIADEVEGHEITSTVADLISRDLVVYGSDGLPVRTLDIECLITGSALPLIDPAIAAEVGKFIAIVRLDNRRVETLADAHALIKKAHGHYPGWKIENGERSSPLAITASAQAWVEACAAVGSDL